MSTSCAPLKTVPCEGIAVRHAAKLLMCDMLETIADSLPSSANRTACLLVSARLLPAVREAHAFEEKTLFPAFGQSGSRMASLQRLRAEHIEDEALAEELTEVLLHVGHGGEIENPEAFGFMLRAFFETMRRHIAFEREHVVPLSRAETI